MSQNAATKAGVESPASGRRTNAERSATMRTRIIDAAVACLHEDGYAATSTTTISAKGGVSRGAMIHHFPTKVDLMLAVAERAITTQVDDVKRRLRGLSGGTERFIKLTRATFDSLCRPEMIAFFEVMLASRGEPGLAAEMPTLWKHWDKISCDSAWRVAEAAGVEDRKAINSMVRLHMAALRGLVFERLVAPDRGRLDTSLDMLVQYKEYLIADLLGRLEIKNAD